MFTGIVEDLGTVVSVRGGDHGRLVVRSAAVTADAEIGASVAVDGCCLTVVELAGDTFAADVSPETLARTSLGALAPGDAVDLERPVRLADRLGGHLVQGHVDAVGQIRSREPAGDGELVRFGLPAGLARYVARKGSIAVDGVSLTVVEAADDSFTVALIPETLRRTTLGRKGVGDPVNLEVDVVAKYVERLLTGPASPHPAEAPVGVVR